MTVDRVEMSKEYEHWQAQHERGPQHMAEIAGVVEQQVALRPEQQPRLV